MACNSCKISLFYFYEIISSEQRLLTFLQQHGVLPENVECPHCKKPCKLYPGSNFRFRCTNSELILKNKRKKQKVSCNFSVSARKDTPFEKSKLTLDTICRFVSNWLILPFPQETYSFENELNLSSSTVVDWCSFCREVCLICMLDGSEQIGGPNKVVEINKAKMGKKEYRGRIIEGQWVFGGIERDSKKCFLVPVSDRGKDTLLKVIKEWVLPGTTIMSDCWKSYDCLTDEGFQQETVNHSKNFVDLDTDAHTQNIERLWWNVRSNIPRFGRWENHFDGYLAECQFRMKYSNHTDRFHHFFKCMAQVYPPAESNFGELSESSN